MVFKKVGLPLIIVISAILVFVVLKMTRPDSKPIEITEKAWVVAMEPARPGSWSPNLTLYGKVQSLWSSTLTSGVTADIVAVEVIEGSKVRKGDRLIQLDDRDARLELVQRQAEVDEALAKISSQEILHESNLATLPREKTLHRLTLNEVGRLEELVNKKVSARSALDAARQTAERQAISVNRIEQTIRDHEPKIVELQARLGKAEALRDKAALEVERTRINAPFNGSIARVLVSPGRRVRNGDQLLEIFDTDALVFRALLPNRYLPVVNKAAAAGQDLMVRGEIDDQPVTARLLSLMAQVNTGSGGVEGLFEIKGEGALLQQGRLTRLKLELPSQDGLIALPHEAIYGADQVYRIDEHNRLELLQVEKVGEVTTTAGLARVLVRSDLLQPGEQILATQLPNAIDGLLVQIAGNRDAQPEVSGSNAGAGAQNP